LKNLLLILIILIFLVSACNSAIKDPSIIVQNYLNALVKKDQAMLISLSCKEWEIDAQKELDSFMNVGMSLEGVACNTTSQSASIASVVCQGNIQMTYDNEIQKIDLSKRIYQLGLENNDWRVCKAK
jgi:hypothetical protein